MKNDNGYIWCSRKEHWKHFQACRRNCSSVCNAFIEYTQLPLFPELRADRDIGKRTVKYGGNKYNLDNGKE